MAKIEARRSGSGFAVRKPGPSLRPKDAATLIIVRQDGPKPRILMGKRHQAHAFMPNIFVFPGGRVDGADSRVKPANTLHPAVEAKLMTRMRGAPSKVRAQALAMAAIRETFEETGLIIGKKTETRARSSHADWNKFLSSGMRPALDPLRYIARAITPPGRTRRFDSRFFVLDANHVNNLDNPATTATDELLEINWLTFAEIEDLDLAWITKQVLKTLQEQLGAATAPQPGSPVMFQYQRGKTWYSDMI
jgi:8-oxo-dGTP pyrophosphatase MutT (NUDIX family)